MTLIFTAKGRAVKQNGVYDYEYFLTDHLGNTRVVYGYLRDTDVFKATMEMGNASEEEDDFENVNSSSRYQDPLYNHTFRTLDIQTPDRSAITNGNLGKAIGPAKMLHVTAGDKVTLEVYARYTTSTAGNNTIINNLVTAVTGAFGIVNAGETQTAYQALNNNLPGTSALIPTTTNVPKAYLYYIIFNSSYVYQQFGYFSVPLEAALGHVPLKLEVNVPVNGFLYTYVANESNVSTATSVFFDDFTIIHEKSTYSLRVVESIDYDPFGVVLEGTHYVDISRPLNSYLYQGEFAEYEKLTGWSRFAGRGNYDAVLGRWYSSDPVSQFVSPYSAMANNPVSNIDPDGRFVPIIVGALVGAYQAHQNGGEWWKGALVGALGGVAGYFAPYGIFPGLAYGSATGATLGMINAALNGGNIGQGALHGGISGGIVGGLTGGIRAGLNGRNLWSGSKFNRFQTGDVPLGNYFDKPTTENLENISNKEFGDVPYEKGVRKVLVSKKPDPDAYYDKTDHVFRDKVDKGAILGYTKYGAFSNRSDVIVPPGAFRTSAEVLTGILGHEYVHVHHFYYIGFPTDESVYASEYAAYDWSVQYFARVNNAYWLGRANHWKNFFSPFQDPKYSIPSWLR